MDFMNTHALYQLVDVLSAAIEARDFYTSQHHKRVSRLARLIAQELKLPNEQIKCIRISATLHDIGKLGIPTSILTKVGKLRKEEFELIKQHPVIGEEILQKVDFKWPIAKIVRQHHERFDGSGYPDGLAGSDILLEARVIAVADVVESMTSARPYRHELGLSAAMAEIVKNRGVLYDPDIVDACCKLYDRHKDGMLEVGIK